MKTELGNGTADQIEAVSGFLTKTAKVTVVKDATQLQFLGHCYAKGLRFLLEQYMYTGEPLDINRLKQSVSHMAATARHLFSCDACGSQQK